jgi:hypothetical protein
MKTKNAAQTTTPTTTGTTGPAPAPAVKTVIHRGLLDKHQLAEISLTNTIYGIANDPATFALIQDAQIITPAFMTTLGTDLQGMSQYTGGTSQAVIDAQQDTGAEAAAKKSLLAKIHYIQSKAKIKYMGNKGVLPEYGIGTNIDISRPALETAGGNIINKLKTDTLPKITAQHGTDLQAALETYKKSKVTQVGGKGDSTSLRVKLTTMVESLAVRRRQLQHAADGEFPYTDPANAGMRKKFDLPLNQPLNA